MGFALATLLGISALGWGQQLQSTLVFDPDRSRLDLTDCNAGVVHPPMQVSGGTVSYSHTAACDPSLKMQVTYTFPAGPITVTPMASLAKLVSPASIKPTLSVTYSSSAARHSDTLFSDEYGHGTCVHTSSGSGGSGSDSVSCEFTDLASIDGINYHLNPGASVAAQNANEGHGMSVQMWIYYKVAPVPKIVVSPSTLDFGTVGESPASPATLPLKVINNGTGPLTVSKITPPADVAGYSVISPSGSFTVPAGGSTTVTIGFAPTDPGPATGNLTITSDDPNNPTVTVKLTGIGAPLPDLGGDQFDTDSRAGCRITDLSSGSARSAAPRDTVTYAKHLVADAGSSTPASGTLTLTCVPAVSGSPCNIPFDVTDITLDQGKGWFTISPMHDTITTTKTLTFTATAANLAPGSYTAQFTIKGSFKSSPMVRQVIFDVQTPCVPDSISFDLLNVIPTPHATILSGKAPTFFAAVDYLLGTMDKGEVHLALRTGKGTTLVLSPQTVKVTRGKSRASLTINPFDLAAAIAQSGENVQELDLKAFLSDSTGQMNVLAATDNVPYTLVPMPKLTMRFGTFDGPSSAWFEHGSDAPLIATQRATKRICFDHDSSVGSTLIGDHRLSWERSGAVLFQWQDAEPGATAELFLYSKTGDQGNVLMNPGPRTVESKEGGDFSSIYMQHPTDPINAVYFQIRYTAPNGQEIRSDPVKVPYEAIWINHANLDPWDPDRQGAPPLTAGSGYRFIIRGKVTPTVDNLYLYRSVSGADPVQIQGPLMSGYTADFTDDFDAPAQPDSGGEFGLLYSLRFKDKGVETTATRVTFAMEQATTAHVAPKTAQAVDLANGSLSSLASTTARDIRSSNMGQSLASIQTAGDVKAAPAVTTAVALSRTGAFSMPAAGATVVAPGSFIGIPSTWHFDPPIPADGSFSANLTLRYSAADLPDDANCEETKLTIVSYDPATGQLVSYPTTLDLANHAATAPIDRLLPYYSLAVLGPFTKATLNFPMVRSTGGADTAVSFLNTGKSDANLSLRGFDQQGNPTDPATGTIKAGQMYSGAASQVLAFPGGANPGWARAGIDTTSVLGLEFLGDSKRLEAFPSPAPAGSMLILPDVELNDSWSTEVHLVNLTGKSVAATLSLRAADGSDGGTYTVRLDPRAKLVNRIEALFPATASPFNGYLLVAANGEVSAAELLVGPQAWAGLNASALTAGGAGATKVYSAQFVSGPLDYTRLNLVNPTNRSAKLVLRGFKDDGTPLGAPSITLDPGKQYQKELGALFGLDPAQLSTGVLVVESDGSGIVGNVTFGDATPGYRYRSALTLTGSPAKSLVIPYLANTSPIVTTVTAFNPNSSVATVQVKVLAADGSAIGNTQTTVAANGRASSPISTWVPAADGKTGGYITLDSDQPLTAFAVIGPAAGDFAAVAAQPIGGAAPPPPVQSPTLTVDPTSLDFGSVATGQTRTLSLTVKNTGTATLTVTGINPASGAFPFTVSPTSFTVAAGAQQALSVTFKPASTGAVKSSFTFASNDPQGASAVIGMTGTGVAIAVAAPKITVSPVTLDFGSVTTGSTRDLTLTVGNTGNAPLTVSAITSGNPRFAATAPAMPFNVAAGAQQAVTIRFSPAAAGVQSGTLAVASNDPATPTANVAITGSGVAVVPSTVLFSDSFSRPDADMCALGAADMARGGSGAVYYMPLYPLGVEINQNALWNGNRDYAGVQFTLMENACFASTATWLRQDLDIQVDLLVPGNARGDASQAGPYFRSRAVLPKDIINGGTSAGYWVQLLNTGEVQVKRLNPEAVVAFTGRPAQFDNTVYHTLEMSVEGNNLQVALDGKLMTFNQGGTRTTTVAVPPAWDGPPAVGTNNGATGILLGSEGNRGNIGGQRARNLVVSTVRSLAGLPVQSNLP